MVSLRGIVEAFAVGMRVVDARRPVAVNQRSKEPYRPGIGPHTERRTVELVSAVLPEVDRAFKAGELSLEVPYPDSPRTKCDLVIGPDQQPTWAVEVKMLRLLGDNGKPNDNMLMHVISPYPEHRSALTDCTKLAGSGLAKRKCILVFAYDHPELPARPALDAFEALAGRRVALLDRAVAMTGPLVHPVHCSAIVQAWEVAELPGEQREDPAPRGQ